MELLGWVWVRNTVGMKITCVLVPFPGRILLISKSAVFRYFQNINTTDMQIVFILYLWLYKETARFIRTVCMRRIRWSCEGLTSVHNEYTGYTLKHLLLRHMYNFLLPMLMCYLLKPYALRLPTCWSAVLGPTDRRMRQRVCVCVSHCTVQCFI